MNKHRKYEGLPGVVYPEKGIVKRPHTEDPLLAEAPKGYITTDKAARLLGCTPAAARQLLARRGVERVLVDGPGRGRAYYSRTEVRRVASARPELGDLPSGLVPASEAAALLGLARSALDRYEKRGVLRVLRRRVRGRAGARVRCFYEASELAALRREAANRLRARLCALEGEGRMTREETLDMIEEYVLAILDDHGNDTLPEWYTPATVASRINYMITSAAGRNDKEVHNDA